MERRTKVVAVAALLLAIIGGLYGARLAARILMGPLAGLDHFVSAPKPHVSESKPVIEETIRDIDLNAPAPTIGSAGPKPAAPGANRALTFSLNSVEAPAESSQELVITGALELILGSAENGELHMVLTLGNEPDLETLASSLGLSDSQKARIAALMEWRRGALDALTDAEKIDAERVQKIEDFYRAALDLELDQNQSRQYSASRSMVLRFNTTRLKLTEALQNQAQEGTQEFPVELEKKK